MPSFDSIVVGENWISEHFFTTDSTKESFQAEVVKLRKSWDEAAKEGHSTTLSRFAEVRGRLQILLAGLSEDPAAAPEAYALLRGALGFKGTTTTVTFERSGTGTIVPGVWLAENFEVVLVEAAPADALEDVLSTVLPLGRVLVDGKEPHPTLTVAKVVSEAYLSDKAPKFIVIVAGRWLVLTEQERWAEGRYLAADVLLVADRNDTKKNAEMDRFLAIFGRDSLMPAPDGSIWWDAVLEASVKHTVGVSQDIREGIRRSIEIIANDVLDRRRAAGLGVEDIDGQILARQSLRFLYRILFLLYAEASPEMGVLPVGAGEYNEGYGLDRLRELTLVNIQSPEARRGTHIYESLAQLFHLVDRGHAPAGTSPSDDASGENEGLIFQPLKADLFHDAATSLINCGQLSNSELQRVLQHLLLSKETKGKDRGFISYAELGINQLGAVYEGLMSYTGFIATEPLHEVAKDGNPEKGSWVVPVERSESIDAKHFVVEEDERTGEQRPVLHPAGSFVFRLAGRERQQSASYYTPEVLTKFVVSQALEELLDQNEQTTAADDILDLTVCEPALGSGAFALEAVRQLADEYLKRKQDELDIRIPADEYPQELQKVKAQIALHQVHGVDLNSTAVELAEVSLWLDTMVKDLQAPWFGLRLRRGNSLIGARRAVYSRQAVNDKSWLKSAPQDAPLTGLLEAMTDERDDANVVGRVHHFLLPAEGWGAAADAKEVKDLAGEAQKELKAWRTRIKSKPSKTQIDRIVNLGRRVESLWKLTLRRLQVAEAEARRDIDYFGKHSSVGGSGVTSIEAQAVTREQIEQTLTDPDGAYQRLRRIMDAWNALWFWPLTDRATSGAQPPTLDEWLSALEMILGLQGKESKMVGQQTFGASSTWEELNDAERADLDFALVSDVEIAKKQHPWLRVCENIAADQGFFHWELDFASVFGRGGFDLQVGNPPWVRPDWDEDAVYSEFDPWWQLNEKKTQVSKASKLTEAKSDTTQSEFMCAQAASIVAVRGFLTSATNYPVLSGLRPDLYRCFMERTWRSSSGHGVVALIHPESHFTEEKAARLRSVAYKRLRRHWQFRNALHLFEIKETRQFGVNVYGCPRKLPEFINASWLYHPSTVERSLQHDGGGHLPGIKAPDGSWDVRPHRGRILTVDAERLEVWSRIANDGSSWEQARMSYSVADTSEKALLLLTQGRPLIESNLVYASGWNETTDRTAGKFEHGYTRPEAWSEVILQGPHIYPGLPIFKEPNSTLKNNLDWSAVDLWALDEDFIPSTAYVISSEQSVGSTDWNGGVNRYRLAWRRRLDMATERTLQAAIIPPGAKHVDPLGSVAFTSEVDTVLAAAAFTTLPLDFLIKSSGSTDLRQAQLRSVYLPLSWLSLRDEALVRTLRLNAVTRAYAPLWNRMLSARWSEVRWTTIPLGAEHELSLSATKEWDKQTPLRSAHARRQAMLELDALVAFLFEISIEDLCSLYRTQFPVLHGYEQNDLYDANGHKIPGELSKAYGKANEALTVEERTWTHPKSGVEYVFEFPFQSFDREEDMRKAYAHFLSMLEEKS
ncbi:class I SAM-dependent DNA methyltransferase [Paenarthrobacter sp. RAF54_2]|uniref:Eco57I restriction-modification methylase domain-containing protein n=1 Tax=Paenarthrobacter sp. RAF54_2 TaxID=3233061 RepID=UPI003F9DDE30